MITVKERKDFKKYYEVEEFSIYDLFSQNIEKKKMTYCYISELEHFVKDNISKINKNI